MAGVGDYPVAAVIRAENFERARAFYTEVLGLEEKASAGPTTESVFLAGDGTMLSIYERPGMPAPQNTTLMFGVPAASFTAVMDELKGKGVVFEDYDLPEIGLVTTGGVAEYEGAKIAWFKDTEGNILSVGSM